MSFSPDQNPVITLNNGQKLPQLGLGVYKVGQDIGVELVKAAIEVGYRRFDTAALYDNEFEIGAGMKKSGVDREDLFVTTKIWNDRHGFENATEAIDESLGRLNVGYIDMLLIHWPCPQQNLIEETWRAFEKALEGGKIRGIGVSNFNANHLDKLLGGSSVVPAVNQIELHPGMRQSALREYNVEHSIATEAWSPLGRGRFNSNEVLNGIAAKHGKSLSQVIIRWHIELGNLVIPKTSNPERLKENIDVYDFALDNEDLAAIESLNTNERTGPDPEEFG